MSAKAADAEVFAGAATDTDAGEKPKRRGRPKGSGRKPKVDPKIDDASTQDAQPQSQDSQTGEKSGRKTSRRRKSSRDDIGHDGESDSGDEGTLEADARAAGVQPVRETGRVNEETDEDEGEGEDAPENATTRGRGRSQGRRNNQRRGSLNYRDLQSKILPELHLLAKEVGLSDYRQMSKEELSVAVLERASESEGLRLVRGYLEISSDGYGFLQESMLQNDTRSVIVSAGLIKQFRLRTGDFILGKARKPRDNERYGTLIRVEAVNGVDPFQAAKRPRFDDLVPTFPEERIYPGDQAQ